MPGSTLKEAQCEHKTVSRGFHNNCSGNFHEKELTRTLGRIDRRLVPIAGPPIAFPRGRFGGRKRGGKCRTERWLMPVVGPAALRLLVIVIIPVPAIIGPHRRIGWREGRRNGRTERGIVLISLPAIVVPPIAFPLRRLGRGQRPVVCSRESKTPSESDKLRYKHPVSCK